MALMSCHINTEKNMVCRGPKEGIWTLTKLSVPLACCCSLVKAPMGFADTIGPIFKHQIFVTFSETTYQEFSLEEAHRVKHVEMF